MIPLTMGIIRGVPSMRMPAIMVANLTFRVISAIHLFLLNRFQPAPQIFWVRLFALILQRVWQTAVAFSAAILTVWIQRKPMMDTNPILCKNIRLMPSVLLRPLLMSASPMIIEDDAIPMNATKPGFSSQ